MFGDAAHDSRGDTATIVSRGRPTKVSARRPDVAAGQVDLFLPTKGRERSRRVERIIPHIDEIAQ